MKTIVLTFVAILLTLQPAAAAVRADMPDFYIPVVNASSDCHSVGTAKAAQVGGKLAKATPRKVNGKDVCVVVVLVPGKDGQRPRRTEYVIAQ